MSQYMFNAAPQAARQYAGLEHNYDVHTVSYLEATGVVDGGRCLEVGAGRGSIAGWLAERVGLDGHVVATDIDPRFLAGLTALNLPNLEVQRHDIGEDDLPEQSFDLIHARLVLIHVPKRKEALARMVAALKPGGWLVIEDYDPVLIEDRGFPVRNAAHRALFQKMVTALPQLLSARGHETGWARKLYTRFREHGLVEVGMEGHLVVASGNSSGAWTLRAMFEQVHAEAVAAALATDQELETFLMLLNDPEFDFSLPIMMSAWGQRP